MLVAWNFVGEMPFGDIVAIYTESGISEIAKKYRLVTKLEVLQQSGCTDGT
jgi:hypothetical protein